MKFQKLIKPIIITAIIALVLLAAFFAPEQSSQQAPVAPPVTESVIEEPVTDAPEAPVVEELPEPVIEEIVIEEPVAEELPEEIPVEVLAPAQPQCTVSITCAELLAKMDLLDEAKHDLVPADGFLLAPTVVTLAGGESVFDVVSSAVRANNLHMDYTAGAITSYIKGVGNLYEFDAGPTSGWTYSVNGIFSNKDSGSYLVENGDIVQLVYSLTPKTLQ